MVSDETLVKVIFLSLSELVFEFFKHIEDECIRSPIIIRKPIIKYTIYYKYFFMEFYIIKVFHIEIKT